LFNDEIKPGAVAVGPSLEKKLEDGRFAPDSGCGKGQHCLAPRAATVQVVWVRAEVQHLLYQVHRCASLDQTEEELIQHVFWEL
jgi:hypothetical protein